MVQWLKLCQLLVDWQSPRGTLTRDGILFFFFSATKSLVRRKGGRKISTHSLSETRPTTKGVEGDRRKKFCIECYTGISSFQ